MKRHQEFKNTCRLCLKYNKSESMISLFEKDTLNYYGQAIQCFAKVHLKKADMFPSSMCKQCLILLKQCIYFKFTCESSEKQLHKTKSLYNNNKISLVDTMQDHNNCKNISNKLLDIHGEGSQRSIFETLNSRNSSLDSSNHDFQSKSVNPDLTDILLDEIEMLLEDDSFNCDTVSKLLKKHNASHKLQANKKPQASKRTNLIENHFNGDSSKCSNSPGKRIYVNPDTVLDEIDCMINSRYLDENDDQDSFDNSKPDTVVNNEEQNYSEVFDSIDKLICDNNTASVILRKYQHNKFMKQRQKKRKCRICGKQLANPSSYRVHMNLHAKKNRFICEQCGNTYTTLVGLQCHKLTKHGTGPYIQCSQCSFKASRRFDMIEHERIHTGERPFTCDKCGLTFRRRYIYKNHLIKHTEKKVQCSQCPKKFFRREDMLAHCNSNHKRCYMFKCSECDTLYAKISTVRRHLIDKHGVPREIQPKLVRVMMADIV